MTKQEIREYLADNLTEQGFKEIMTLTDIELLEYLVNNKIIINSDSPKRQEGEEREQYRLRRKLLQLALKRRLKYGPNN